MHFSGLFTPWCLDRMPVKPDTKLIREMYRMSEGLSWILGNHRLAFEQLTCQMSLVSGKDKCPGDQTGCHEGLIGGN